MTHAPSRTLVATLGPASLSMPRSLVEAGVDVFRLNGSHMTADELGQAIEDVRRMTPSVPFVVDLQGAKMRLGNFAARPLRRGQRFDLTPSGSDAAVPLPHPEVFEAVREGDTLSCDDDRVHLRVEAVSRERLEVASLVDGTLRPRKGVNVIEHPVDLEDLTPTDVAQIEVAGKHEHVAFACSFMRDGREAAWIRNRLPGAHVVGKVERAEAIEAIEAVAQQVNEVWICRGDLGAQLGLVRLARWLSDFDPRRLPVPVFIAGQVLEHLTQHLDPTRSEVCHLYDLLRRGFAGVVLSDETAIGTDPIRATRVARELIDTLAVQRSPTDR